MKNKIYTLVAVFFTLQLSTIRFSSAQNCCAEANSLNTTGIARHTVTLNFTYPGSSNCPARKFKVRYRISGSMDPWVMTTGQANNTNEYSVIIGFLESNTKYSWQVRTVCAGNGTTLRSGWTPKETFKTLARLGDPEMPSTNSTLKIYPNPAHDFLWIEQQFEEPTNVWVTVYDLSGRKVYSESVTAAEGNFSHRLSVAMLPAGIYFLEVAANGENSVSKIVKQ